ncbi:MAG: TetR/AcrR family transcriptional regulator [Nocardioidaceae bacterium]
MAKSTKPSTAAGEAVDAPSRADLTRTRIMQAAVEAFAARGYHGTTTRDIAAAAGMSPAVVYVHHDSKEELLYSIARSGHEETLKAIQTAATTADDPTAQLEAVIRAFVLHHVEGHTAARVINYELAALSDPHRAEIDSYRQAIDALFDDVVARGIEAGAFHLEHPRFAVVALQSLGIDIARWYREGGWSQDDLAAAYVEMALRIVGAG